MSFSFFFWPLNCFPHFAILMWLLKAKCDNVILQIKIDIAMF